jgi:protein phosphatase
MVVNIGDSRTYRAGADGLRQLTVDHSVVRHLIDAGAIVPSAATAHRHRNLLTRALLAETEHQVDVSLLPMRAGDRILVCSDGLTADVDDERIARVMLTIPDPRQAADALVRTAVDAGARDDVTVLVIDAGVVERT